MHHALGMNHFFTSQSRWNFIILKGLHNKNLRIREPESPCESIHKFNIFALCFWHTIHYVKGKMKYFHFVCTRSCVLNLCSSGRCCCTHKSTGKFIFSTADRLSFWISDVFKHCDAMQCFVGKHVKENCKLCRKCENNNFRFIDCLTWK